MLTTVLTFITYFVMVVVSVLTLACFVMFLALVSDTWEDIRSLAASMIAALGRKFNE